MKSKKDYSILKKPISKENISRISELIVLRAIKTHCGYAPALPRETIY